MNNTKYIDRSFISLSVLFIILPIGIGGLDHYQLKSGYLTLGLVVFIFPGIITVSLAYLNNRTTITLWCIRLLALIIFLSVGGKQGVSNSDLLSFLGTIGLTLFYEFGFYIIKSGQLDYYLQFMVFSTALLCIYLLIFLVPLVLENPMPSFYMPIIRDNYHHAWPNNFSVYLLINILMAIYLGQANKAYLLCFFIIFSVFILTFCRTSFGALGIIGIMMTHDKFKGKLLYLPTIMLTILMICVLFVSLNRVKERSSASINGTKIVHSFKMRKARYSAVVGYIKKNYITGSGFRSASENIRTMTTYQGKITKMISTHNDYLDIMARSGVIYSFLFFGFVVYIIKAGLLDKGRRKKELKFFSYSLIAIMISSMTQNVLKVPLTSSLFWVFIAFIGCVSAKRDGEVLIETCS